MIAASKPRDPCWMTPGMTKAFCNHFDMMLNKNGGKINLPKDVMFFRATAGTYFQMNLTESITAVPKSDEIEEEAKLVD